jgi:probable rRNA maturation factor
MTSPYRVDVRVDEQVEVVLGDIVGRLIEEVVVRTLVHEDVLPPAEVTVFITSDEAIRSMNFNYRGFDKATDVLCFPRGDEVEGAEGYLGDIAISVQSANDQATRSGHSLEEELQLLSVHATLHLLGHDHALPQEKERMWSTQSAILRSVGVVGITVPDEKA